MKQATQDSSLHSRKSTKRKQQPGYRHKPQRSILRSKDGVYEVAIPNGPMPLEDAVEDLRLQVNTLTLTCNTLMRRLTELEGGKPRTSKVENAVQKEPRHIDHTVVPMRPSGRKATASENLAASGVSTPGNEAEQLPPPVATIDLATGEATVDPLPTPTSSNVVQLDKSRPAANDPSSDEVVQTTPETDVVEGEVDDLADFIFNQYLWNEDEAVGVLQREFMRRDKHSRKRHGLSYDEVRMKRWIRKANAVGYLNQKGARPYAKYISVHSCERTPSSFSELDRFITGTNWSAVKLANRMEANDRYDQSRYAYQAMRTDCVKAGWKKRQERREFQRKLDLLAVVCPMRAADHFAMFNERAERAMPSPRKFVTSASQWEYHKMLWRDRWDRVRTFFGMEQRTWHHADQFRDNVTPQGKEDRDPVYVVPDVADYETPIKELVKNRAINGVGH